MKKEMRMILKDGTISEFRGYTSFKEKRKEEAEEEEEEEEDEEDEDEEEEEEEAMQYSKMKRNQISSPQQGVNPSVRRWKILVRVAFDPNQIHLSYSYLYVTRLPISFLVLKF
ncbi:hypothetical protein Tco_0582881 [Tanacetum coccineum]